MQGRLLEFPAAGILWLNGLQIEYSSWSTTAAYEELEGGLCERLYLPNLDTKPSISIFICTCIAKMTSAVNCGSAQRP